MQHSLFGWLKIGFLAYRDTLRFRGRLTRSEVLCFMIVAAVVQTSLDIATQAILTRDILRYPFGWRTQPIGQAIALVAWLPIWSQLIRRMHDYNRPAWQAIAFLLALHATAFAPFPATGPASYLTNIVAGLILVALGWVLTLYPPTTGPNRYGPDPRI